MNLLNVTILVDVNIKYQHVFDTIHVFNLKFQYYNCKNLKIFYIAVLIVVVTEILKHDIVCTMCNTRYVHGKGRENYSRELGTVDRLL